MLGSENLHDEESSENSEDEPIHECPADVLLTGKAVRSEIKLKDLKPEDRAKFEASMAKEWSSRMKFDAVQELTAEEIAQLPPDTKIIGMRWVHTDKNDKPRLLAKALAKRTGKTADQIKKEFPFEAKSRMVVQGCQENDNGIRSDSPTASLLAFNLVCTVAVLQRWILVACDASTAYLQSQGIDRLLILRAPRPPPPGVAQHALFRAKGSIYGTKDAGRSWWKKLFRTLRKYRWTMSKIEAALFYLVSGDKLVGVMLSHVDDLLAAGEGSDYEATLMALEKELYLKVKRQEFRFCGKNVKQKDNTIAVDQFDAIESIDYMLLAPARRKLPNATLTEEEKSNFRALIGQMGWVTRQSRPDLTVNVSMASQSMGRPTVKDVVELNKAVKMLKETSEAKWRFVASDLTLEGLKSQCGYVVGLTKESITDGSEHPIYLLETYSGSIKRVCRSTLAAESNGFLAGAEAAEYVRMILMEVKYPTERLIDLDREFKKDRVLCFTDAKSLESSINKDAGISQDKRVRILLAQVKELLGLNDYQDDKNLYAIWVDTSQILADVLTKCGCEREPLLSALFNGTWRLEPSDEAQRKKEQIRAGRKTRKEALRKAEGPDKLRGLAGLAVGQVLETRTPVLIKEDNRYVESSIVPLSVKVVLAVAQEQVGEQVSRLAQILLSKIEAIRLITCTGRFSGCYPQGVVDQTMAELCSYINGLQGRLNSLGGDDHVCEALFQHGDGGAMLRAIATPLQKFVELAFPRAAPPALGNFGSRFNFEYFFSERAKVVLERGGTVQPARLSYPPIFSPGGICSMENDDTTQSIGPDVAYVLTKLRQAKDCAWHLLLASSVTMSNFVVNFGAADGECGSEEDWNADPANCLTAEGYSAVLVEGDQKFFESLRDRYGNRSDVSMAQEPVEDFFIGYFSRDLVFEYWAGNPSNEIFHGHITVAAFPDVDGSHGAKQSSEYLLALQMASPEDVSWLVRSFHGRPYNAIEASICSLHPVLSSQTGCLEENASPSAENCALAKRRSPVLPPLPPALPQSVDDKLHSLATGSTSLPSPLMLPSVPRKSSPLMSPCSQPEVPELFIQSGAGTHGIVSPTPTSSGNERSYCAVCFETVDSNPAEYQLTELGGGVPLTILCGHTFHARCLSRWCDSTCPVCRFQQHPYQTSSCDVCGQVEGVHICLVCGFIGCTAHPGQGHAQQHFEATSHAYALDVNTQHVWDYAGNGYVHRLLYNDQDGKMVEHSVPQDSNESLAISAQSVFGGLRWADMEDDDCDKIAALFTRASAVSTSSGAKKQEAIVGEFNNLLSSQLTAQRQHFDELRQDIEKHAASEIEDMEAQVATAKGTADSVHRPG
ncbi:brap-2 [Symbiodinium necroappetens]|uniref:Brap-2 protein n=1 Tax=Symbiodinium necroappetens TaxID=1628268 RepID=A0A813BWE0_9DINO|nr:brap-2 [Symbiodinium necroappetens]